MVFSWGWGISERAVPQLGAGVRQNFCYNVGRAIGSIGPALVDYLSGTIPFGVVIGYLAAGPSGGAHYEAVPLLRHHRFPSRYLLPSLHLG